jgi:WD40 repeat protein/serine/threonine protein kinase
MADRFCLRCGTVWAGTDADLCPACAALDAPPSPVAASSTRSFPTEELVPPDWAAGDLLLDLYEVRGLLGEGGMARVYRVWHRGWNLELAVKTPLPSVVAQAGAQAFADEARTWVDLGLHPNIVSCFYVRSLGGIPRVFAELVAGGSLKDAIANRRLYAGTSEEVLARLLDVAIQFAWGLEYAHAQGLVHQDVKPGNVLLTLDGVAKVADFGLARSRVRDVAGTGGSQVVRGVGGTPAYYSPEQAAAVTEARAGTPLDERTWLTRGTDIWSWAASVLEMFAGGRTWEWGQAAPSALEANLAGGPPDGIPPMPLGLVELLRTCLQVDPQDRPRDFGTVTERLAAIYEEVVAHPYPRSEPAAAEMLAANLSNRAISLLDLGRDDEAMAALDGAVHADPGHAEAVYNRAMLLWSRGALNDDEAVAAIRATAEASGDWRGWLHLAAASRRRRDAPGHGEALEAARRLGAPDDELARWPPAERGEPDLGRYEDSAECRTRVRQLAFGDDGGLYAICEDGAGWTWASGVGARELADASDRATYLPRTQAFIEPRMGGKFDVWVPRTGARQTLKVFGWSGSTKIRRQKATLDGSESRMVVFLPEVMEVAIGKVALAAPDGRVVVWDLPAGGPIAFIQTDAADVPPGLSVACGGARVALSTGQGTVSVWDLAGGPVDTAADDHARRTGSTWNATPVARADASTFGDVLSARLAGSTERGIALTPDGSRLAVTIQDTTIGVWNVETRTVERVLRGHGSSVLALVALPRGPFLASGGADGMVRLWDMEQGTCIRTLGPHRGHVRSLAVSADGSLLAAGTTEGQIRIWDVATIGPLPKAHVVISTVRTAEEVATARSQVDELVAECDDCIGCGDWQSAATCVESARAISGFERHQALLDRWRTLGRYLPKVDLRDAWRSRAITAHAEQVHAVAISPRGRAVASGGADGALNLWELQSGERVGRVERAHGGGNLVCLAYEAATGTLASGGADGRVRLWDFESLEPIGAWEVHRSGLHGVRFAPDGSAVAAAAMDGVIQVNDSEGNRLAKRSLHHELYSVAYSPDGQLLAVSTNRGRCHLLEARSLKTVRVLEGHEGTVFCSVFAPRARHVLTGGQDQTLRVWDAETGGCLGVYRGHDDMVLECRYLPDGHHAASVSWDGTLRLWRLDLEDPIRTLVAHPGQVQAMDASDDGYYIASGGWDGTVGVWVLDWALGTPSLADPAPVLGAGARGGNDPPR